MRRPRQVFILLLVSLSIGAGEQPADTFSNPLDVLIADPFVLKLEGRYYLYGTTNVHQGLEVWTSHDLVNWQNRGYAFRKTDDTWSRGMFWAPEVVEIDGSFYMHFSARGREQSHRIVLAKSDSPLGPFHEAKAPWFKSDQAVIDSHVFTDKDGSRHLYYVIDCAENHHSEIRVRRLTRDLQVEDETHLCIKPSQPWEGTVWNEAPFVVKRNGTYYLMYSANSATDASYSVGYATSESPLGPWTKYEGNPILARTHRAHGPGHHCIIESPDGSELFIVYHTHQHAGPTWQRQLAIDRLRFVETDSGCAQIAVDGPTTKPQPVPLGARPFARGQDDEFDGDELDRARWSIFNERRGHVELRDGKLRIRTQEGDIYHRRSDLKNLVLQYAPQRDFTVTTRVRFDPRENFEQAFLCLWQDHNNFVRFSTAYSHGQKLEIVHEVHGDPIVRSIPNTLGHDPYLRVSRAGDRCTFLASADGENWTTVAENIEVDLHDLKVGLGAASPRSGASRVAEFECIRFE